MHYFFVLLFTADKMKDERVESPADGFSAVLSYLGSVESEKQELTDLEQLKIKKPDEVCKIKSNVEGVTHFCIC